MEPVIDTTYLITIVQKSNYFEMEHDTLRKDYGIKTTFNFKNQDNLFCYYCNLSINDSKEGDKWYLLNINKNIRHYCHNCLLHNHLDIKESYQKDQDLNKKIPSRIIKIKESIIKHRNYDKLDEITRFQFEGCEYTDKNIKRDNNKFTRELWNHLYHGTKNPIG